MVCLCMPLVFEEAREESLFSVCTYQRRHLCVWALQYVFGWGLSLPPPFCLKSLLNRPDTGKVTNSHA